MTYIDAIRDGVRVVNRNWQLLVVKVVAALANCLLFVILVAVPAAVVLVSAGIDTGSLAGLENVSDAIAGFLSAYAGMTIFVLLFLLLYLLVVSVIVVFVYGASAGVIASGLREREGTFSLSLFFREGRRLLMPMFAFLTVAGLLIIAAMIVAVLVIAGIAGVVSSVGHDAGGLSYLIAVLAVIAGISVMLFISTFALAVTFYGTAILVLEGRGAFESVRRAVVYLYRSPAAYWFYCILMAGTVAIAAVFALAGLAVNRLGMWGLFLALPFQILSYAAQGYAGLVVTGSLFSYYLYGGSIGGMSTSRICTSSRPG